MTPPALLSSRVVNLPPPDGSRDPRIEDPTNRWIVHLLGRMLLPLALRARIPANAVSVLGLLFGLAAAGCYFQWSEFGSAVAGFLLSIAWLVADGLDGMIARATRTTSAIGRLLDGLCDHIVFVAIYVAIASSLGTLADWTLAISAGAAHALQANLYEGERTRFHRRRTGLPPTPQPGSRYLLVRIYDAVAGALDRLSAGFERMLYDARDTPTVRETYCTLAVRPLGFMWVLSNNVRVMLIFASCAIAWPQLFWWVELIPLSLVAFAGIVWHKRLEANLLRNCPTPSRYAAQANAKAGESSKGG